MTNLFEGIEKDKTNADIGWMNDKSSFYNNGYLTAARELTINYADRSTSEKDTLVFPIIFLYRQYVELTLKDLIRELDKKLGYVRNDHILKRHKLLPLWDVAIEQYNSLISEQNITLTFTSALKKEREIINQFNQLDEDSFSFRYATDTKGNETLKDVQYISINNFENKIESVVAYIEGMIETLSHHTN